MGDGRRVGDRAVFALAATLAWATIVQAAPPRVVSATPDNADVGVDAGTTEIVVRFDQDMRAGVHSVCGGGPNFPKLAGELRWRDARTVVIPVQLSPDTRYDLSINCQAAQNFQSVNGEGATPYGISFRTAKAGEAGTSLTAEQAAACAAEFRRAIDERYSYRDERGLDWNAVFAQHREGLVGARTPSAFARAASALLGETNDVHCSVRVGEFVLPGGRASADPNMSWKLLARTIPNLKQRHRAVASGRFEDGVGYILIGGWGNSPDLGAALDAALEDLKDTGAMVIDVRANSGGDEAVARRFASRFVAERAVYSRNRFRQPGSKDGWGPMLDRVVEPAEEGKRYRGRVVVLMGPACMSSCESFLLMMRHGAKATLIGEKSWGTSGNPKPVELSCGVTVVLSSWQDYQPDGTLLEGKGIEPDVVVRSTAEERVTKDPVLEEARRRTAESGESAEKPRGK